MKNLMVASALAVALTFGFAPTAPAEAKTTVQIFFGVPHYGYRVGPGYRYRAGFGWYRPGYGHFRGHLSCGEAKWHVRNRGYRNVSTVECRGSTYTFRAWRAGHPTRVLVNARTGAVWRA